MKYSKGLVLSGGGYRAVAHIGLLKALKEHNIEPQVISGTSGGAVVGALYAAGYSADKMLEFFHETPVIKFSIRSLRQVGFIDSNKYINILEKYFPKNSFGALNIPLFVATTNILSGKLEFYSKGRLIQYLIASSALPPIFSPVSLNNSLYSDGGILNNFPVEPLLDNCKCIIGSYVNPLNRVHKNDVNSTLKLTGRVFHIALDAQYKQKFKHCDFMFLPKKISNYSILKKSNIDEIFEVGYHAAIQQMDKIKASLCPEE
ncbi:patatin-like phospholipase family protein [Aureivirga marina]|uniref:patatin-like phospholipase family protein n=1 Tax=Aureivirga marina TaxID=1182451 RepID=UPI0018CB8310|nr:patatin-like phospholipase family protein [Aureivirga marina]